MVKNLPTKQYRWIRSLGWEDSLEEKMATDSSILACEIPWTEEPGGLESVVSQSQAWLSSNNSKEQRVAFKMKIVFSQFYTMTEYGCFRLNVKAEKKKKKQI